MPMAAPSALGAGVAATAAAARNPIMPEAYNLPVPADPARKLMLPSLASLVLAAALAFSFCTTELVGDFGMHLRVGQWALEHHSIPRVEFLTFTAPGHEWITQQWLTGVILAVLEPHGLAALFAVSALVFTLTLFALYRTGREIGAEPLSLVLLV